MAKWNYELGGWIVTGKDKIAEEEGLSKWLTIGHKRLPVYVDLYLQQHASPIQEKAVRGLLGWGMNVKGWLIHPSYEQQATRWNVHRRTARRWIKSAVDAGFITKRYMTRKERRQREDDHQEGRLAYTFENLVRNASIVILGKNYDAFARECEEARDQREFKKAEKRRLAKEAREEAKKDIEFRKAIQEGKLVERPGEELPPEEIALIDKNLEWLERHREEERLEEKLEKMRGEKVQETPPIEETIQKLEDLKSDI